MLRRIQILLTSLLALCSAGSAVARATEPTGVTTGLTHSAPAIVILAIATALLLTLVFRASANHLMRATIVKIGARRIRKILTDHSDDMLEDFILPGAYGGLTRIDHAMLTTAGIICIRAKHCNGVVSGSAGEPQWTNLDGGRRTRFLNPLIQNEGRVRALQNVATDVPVTNLVVFTGDIDFNSPLERNVIHVQDLDEFITKFVAGACIIDERDLLWLTVKSAALTDEASRKDFNAQLSFS